MRISTTAHYASRLLAQLAMHDSDKPIPATVLSDSTGISVKFIEKIIRPLKTAGFVRSVRGASGGHLLCIRPEEVTLGQVLRVMEGGVQPPQCCPDNMCGDHDCNARSAWNNVAQALEQTLESITLADLMKDNITSYPCQ
ncbi:RrF2 family transcriptional regulator [Desulfovibrio psychrotolerans]|uniref:Transcriptional regulator n=1 Tax=Desulfovibrio psychrotolerans TaxID=415242 RepID=A0A7J0BQ81_9BACT|nr:Rrf2 family transcriptional regulator [Desulfovibrio psychrotolerans]GFM35829.1 transcriptional regulator [Desulfovibrio psychrotolerans]